MSVPTTEVEHATWLLLGQKIADKTGVEAARAWDAQRIRTLAAVVEEHKGKLEPGDIHLLRDVRASFKEAGLSGPEARQQAVELLQCFLDPRASPDDEKRAAAAKEFLRAAQAGAMYEMRPLLSMYPSVLASRSTSRGYTAMHYAAMGARCHCSRGSLSTGSRRMCRHSLSTAQRR